mgnify:CR=1 FL=1
MADTKCQRCDHPPILHRGGTGNSWSGFCMVTETPWDGGRGPKCSCNFYVEPDPEQLKPLFPQTFGSQHSMQ